MEGAIKCAPLILVLLYQSVRISSGVCIYSQVVVNTLRQTYHASIRDSVYSSRFNDGAILNCACITGYTLTGQCTLTCGTDGIWKFLSECQPVDCGEPPESVDAVAVTNEGTSLGKLAWYSCNKGYVRYYNRTMTCNQNGDWTTRIDLPPCTPAPDCGDPPEVQHSKVQFNRTKAGDVAIYTCDNPYRLIGSRTTRCYDTGFDQNTKLATSKWIYTPRCELDCRPPMRESVSNVTSTHPSYARLLVTTCTDDRCGGPKSYFLQKEPMSMYEDFRLFGSEVCVGYVYKMTKQVTYTKFTPIYNNNQVTDTVVSEEECRCFCVPYINGYRINVVEEHYTQWLNVQNKVTLKRVSKKFATVPLDKGEFGA